MQNNNETTKSLICSLYCFSHSKKGKAHSRCENNISCNPEFSFKIVLNVQHTKECTLLKFFSFVKIKTYKNITLSIYKRLLSIKLNKKIYVSLSIQQIVLR